MLVQKFGGTSVGKPERMHQVEQLTRGEEQRIVVLSAVSGTTNSLVKYNELLKKGDKTNALTHIEALEKTYYPFLEALYSDASKLKEGQVIINTEFEKLKNYAFNIEAFSEKEEKEILAQGEIISTQMFQKYLEEVGRSSKLLSAFDFMEIDGNNEPVIPTITKNLGEIVAENSDVNTFVVQGYICLNPSGEIDNLKRGGSDYTASLIGAGLKTKEIQIWTDIDGMHNNDPRIVDKTKPISELSFDEAAELAYFGAKILHPTCILPAMKDSIPVKLKNTMDPEAHGTVISTKSIDREIKAIAAKDSITAIKIKSARMLLAHGFLKKVFEIFEKYSTSIDMITTSEIAVSLTIDDDANLSSIINELEEFSSVEIDTEQTIICIVGNFVVEKPETAIHAIDALTDIPIRMISYGGSRHNISFLINTPDKNRALQSLNDNLFDF